MKAVFRCVWWARGRVRARPDGFTLVELMVTVAIIGVLASVALPNFKKYKYKAQSAEAVMSLGAMSRGLKAYFQQEHWAQGVMTSGSSAGGGCFPDGGSTSNVPSSNKTVLDWSAQDPSFSAIGFTPGDPLLFTYFVGINIVPGTATYWQSAGCSGFGVNDYHPGCCGHAPDLWGGNYEVVAFGNLDDTSQIHAMAIGFCTNVEGELYECNRYSGSGPSICAVSFAGGSRADGPTGAGVMVAVAFVLGIRRRQKGL